ncbi:MAG: isoprenylcysteine carboxylmethyltransferase family protein [Candidatus Aminicenantes bacterium]|nr:isoprenylcysteine carboxylmethyltransferase family protein [Candidatus Aminicenantes bacterium]
MPHRHENREDLVGEHPFGDAGQIIFLILFLILWGLDSFVLQFSTFLAGYAPLMIRLVFAGLILAAGFYLGKKSIQIVFTEKRDSPQVIKKELYSFIRHPMYMAMILFYVALIVATMSLLSLVLGILIFLFYNYIAAHEEKLLENKLGQDYVEYKKKVPRWFPR